MTGSVLFFLERKAGFIAASGLISFAWGVHCQTTVFILPFINDWWPFEIKQQMIAGIETGPALHDKDNDKTNMMEHTVLKVTGL